jgi:hypothetical protein
LARNNPRNRDERTGTGRTKSDLPKAVLAYLSRYTHRVAISNRRLISADQTGVTFRWKDYRIEGPGRYQTMKLSTHEFIRRFLIHVLPRGFHRIRHRAANIASARELLAVPDRGQISIAPAALSVSNPPRFPALALFGRRPP